MAIAYRQSTSVDGAGAGLVTTPALGSAPLAGSLMVGIAGNTQAGPLVWPVGWTVLVFSGGPAPMRTVELGYRVASAAEPSTLSINQPAAGAHLELILAEYTGTPAVPIVLASAQTVDPGTSAAVPSLTPAAGVPVLDLLLIWRGGGSAFNYTEAGTRGPYNQRVSSFDTGDGAACGLADLIIAATSGTYAGTLNRTDLSGGWNMAQVMLAAGGGGSFAGEPGGGVW